MLSKMLKCFGFDPGLALTGWAYLEGYADGEPLLIDYGTIETAKTLPTPQRLAIIEQDVMALIAEFQPNLVAMEMPFFNRQIKAAGGVLQSVGVINLVCYRQAQLIPILLHQSSWKAHLGNGKADKKEVADLVQSLFGLESLPIDDAVDAIGIAYGAFSGLRNEIS